MKQFLRACTFIAALSLPVGTVHSQFQNDDLLIGKGNSGDTLGLVRGGALVADPFSQAFISVMDFDNTGGINNNAAGNLLMIDRGTGAGSVYHGATDGSGTTTLIGDFNGGFAAFDSILASVDVFEQIAVSPDNSKVVITTPGSAGPTSLFLFDYDPSMVGVDNFKVLTNSRELNNVWANFGNHDLEWMDNDTLLLVDGDAAFVDTIDLDGSGNFDVGSRTRRRELLGPTGGNQPLDGDSGPVAFNPDISPFVFVGGGDFNSGATAGERASNYIWVLDPTQTETNGDWKQVARARYDGRTGDGFNQGVGSERTIRDLELLSNGDLAIATFGGSLYTLDMSTLDGSACGDPADFDLADGGCGGLTDDTGATLVIDGDVVFDENDPPDNSSESRFVNLTIARTALGLTGDFDGDDDVDGADFLEWQRQFPTLTASDLADWQAAYPGASVGLTATVPEPSTAITLLLGMVALFCRRKTTVSQLEPKPLC